MSLSDLSIGNWNVIGGDRPAMGKEYYVRASSEVNYGYWAEMFSRTQYDGTLAIHNTIESAQAVADAYDTIWVWPSYFEPAATMTIDQKGLRIKAVQTAPFMGHSSTMMYACGTAACDPIIEIDTHNVEIEGFRFYPYITASGEGAISIAAGAAAYGAWIHNNIFYVVPESLQGLMPADIRLGSTSFDAAYTLIENNYFFCGGTFGGTPIGMIDWVNGTRSCIRGNLFNIISNQATQAAIYVHNSSDRYPRGWILDNEFFGAEIDVSGMQCYGVLFEEGVDAGTIYQNGNRAVNITAAYSDVGQETLGLNYNNATAATVSD